MPIKNMSKMTDDAVRSGEACASGSAEAMDDVVPPELKRLANWRETRIAIIRETASSAAGSGKGPRLSIRPLYPVRVMRY